MCKKQYQGTAPLLDCPFIKIIASQRLKPFVFFSIDVYLHEILLLISRAFSISKCMIVVMLTHSFPGCGCWALCWKLCWTGRQTCPHRADGGDKNQTWNSDSRRWTLPRHVRCYGSARCWPYLGLRKPSLKSWRLCWEQEEDGTVFEAP